MTHKSARVCPTPPATGCVRPLRIGPQRCCTASEDRARLLAEAGCGLPDHSAVTERATRFLGRQFEKIQQRFSEGGGAFRILEGNAGRILDNFADKWGTGVSRIATGPDRWQIASPGGGTFLTHYRYRDTALPTIQLSEEGNLQKVRLGSSSYSY